jgi:hypothetical protein
MCSDAYAMPWRQDLMTHDVVTSAHWQQHMIQPSAKVQRCRMGVMAIQSMLAGLLVVMTAAQGLLAIAMRKYSKDMERLQREGIVPRHQEMVDEKPRVSVEKA